MAVRARNEAAEAEARALARRTADRQQQSKHDWTPPKRQGGRVILWAPEAGVRVVTRHADLPQIDQEGGGWRTVPRSRRRPITVWDGPEARRETVVVMLDGWDEFPARSVRPQMQALRKLWRRVDGLDRPPWLKVVGVVPFAGTRWVVESPRVEELQHRRGVCVRARVTLTLLEWVDPVVDLRVARQRQLAKPRWHEWQSGDTLQKLAKRYLRDARRGPDIRALNPKVRQWSKVPRGTRIRIPAR